MTRELHIGNVSIGGSNPVAIQSMLDIPTSDIDACLFQIGRLAEIGCEIIRLAIPSKSCLEPFAQICKKSPLPVVADIHFDYRLAIAACDAGASKLRINPGNIGGIEKALLVADHAKSAGIPIRIGVNAGSLDALVAKENHSKTYSISEKLALSALYYVERFEAYGFEDIVISAKSHDVPTTVEAYRKINKSAPHVPLHLGITEAGTLRQGTIKSSIGMGILLAEGIGDTMRVSLTASLEDEVLVAKDILASLGLRKNGVEIISCPTCARCKVDLQALVAEVEKETSLLKGPISIAVMGCVVNGPGEAKDADIGVACSGSKGTIFSKGHIISTVEESQIVDELLSLVNLSNISR